MLGPKTGKFLKRMPKIDVNTSSQETELPSEDFFGVVLAEREVEQRTPRPKQLSPEARPVQKQADKSDQWLAGNFEGQLAVDVYQTPNSIVIQSTLAGVRVQDIDIAVNNDMVTIRGIRRRETAIKPEDYFYQECYWGGFSRSIILPFDVRAEKVTASLKNGVLTVTLPKAEKPRTKNIRVREELDDEEKP